MQPDDLMKKVKAVFAKAAGCPIEAAETIFKNRALEVQNEGHLSPEAADMATVGWMQGTVIGNKLFQAALRGQQVSFDTDREALLKGAQENLGLSPENAAHFTDGYRTAMEDVKTKLSSANPKGPSGL